MNDTYYVAGIPFNSHDSLTHHGIKGQKWGTRNGPPYPLDAEDHSKSEVKAGWKQSLDNNGQKSETAFYRESSKRIKKNKDGSSTVPRGFTFNRVGQQEMRVNKSGALYVSYGKEDAARYVKYLGPTLIGKLMGNYGTTVQHIKANKDMRVASNEQAAKHAAKVLLQNDKNLKEFNSSFYSYSANDTGEVTIDDLKNVMSNPSSKESLKIAYAVSSMLADAQYSDIAKAYYSSLSKEGFDAVPDLLDRFGGTSRSAMIIINPSKVNMESSTEITKDVMKAAKKYVKTLEKIKTSDIIK